jgi:hypothetical protein
MELEIVRKTPHTTHKGGSREVSHVQKFNKWGGGWWGAGREKMVQQRTWAKHGFYRRWKLRKLVHANNGDIIVLSEIIMLSKVSQAQKVKGLMFSLICGS